MRIVSLLPSATEIVDCLGMTEYLVGRSHECDYPSSVESLPVCTAPKFHPEGTSAEVHDRVTNVLQQALSVYEVKIEVLQELQPTHIITQSQCEVCAVSLADVEQAVSELTECSPQIISLQPNYLDEIWLDIERVGASLGIEYSSIVNGFKHRVEAIKSSIHAGSDRPRTACIEWIEPLMAAGNWIPELVEIAGGTNLFGAVGQHSPWLQWQELATSDPDIIIFLPCGFDLAKTEMEVHRAFLDSRWHSLSAFHRGQIYVTDGNGFFNRPGPRLVESLEILHEIIHPEISVYGHQGTGWKRWTAS